MVRILKTFLMCRDKHGRPFNHPDYDPRTLCVSRFLYFYIIPHVSMS